MKNYMKFILVLGFLTVSQISVADISDLNDELIEADAIGADSEAAIIESEELRAQLIQERKEAKELSQKLEQEKETAKIQKKKAEKSIADNEAKISSVQKQIKAYQKEMIALEVEQAKLKEKNNKVAAELDLLKNDESKALDTKRGEERQLKDIQSKHKDMKLDAKKTALRINGIKSDVKKAKTEISKTYRDMKKDSNDYKRMIKTYRQSLAKASKMLDELEMSIEVDKAYDNKLAQMGKRGPNSLRTVSGLNQNRVASVKAASCNVLSFPSKKAEVMGAYKSGKEVQMKYHSRSWYTVVYGGEKAFLDKGCFN